MHSIPGSLSELRNLIVSPPGQWRVVLQDEYGCLHRVVVPPGGHPRQRDMTVFLDIERHPDSPSDQVVVDAGKPYDAYRELQAIIVAAKTSVLIVDPYVSHEIVTLYLARCAPAVTMRVLTKNSGTTDHQSFVAEQAKFRQQVGQRFDARIATAPLHDRYVFVDDKSWATGQSLKDMAKKSATYLVELRDVVPTLRAHYEGLWTAGTPV